MGSPLGLTTYTGYGTAYSYKNVISGVRYTQNSSETVQSTKPDYEGGYNSILNGSKWYYRPTVSFQDDKVSIRSKQRHTGGERYPEEVIGTEYTNEGSERNITTQRLRRGNDIYDISTNSIIEYTQQVGLPALKLEASHFAYLKDLGVYPNNRLIVARRFPSPAENDLTVYNDSNVGPSNVRSTIMSPISTIVSWIPDDQEDFFNFELGEEWTNGSFPEPIKELGNLFNRVIGKALPMNLSDEGSGLISGIFKKLPIGGIAEALEIEIMNYLLGKEGQKGTNFAYNNLPMGNPNYMSESVWREIGSIKSTISIPVKVSYEMKFINGIDPTIAFMDVVQNVLRFSSSQSVFYMSNTGGSRINEFIKLFKDGKWLDAIKIVLEGVVKAAKSLGNFIKETFNKLVGVTEDAINGNFDVDGATKRVLKIIQTISESSLARYRIEFNKLIPAMTGAASAPWHVTIGNPKNPFFSSGDMIVENSKVTFGNILGFNDLPNRIDFEFTIRSARNLGIQEIFDKFNVGAGRQYQRDSIQFEIDWNQGSINSERDRAIKAGEEDRVARNNDNIEGPLLENQIREGSNADYNSDNTILNPDYVPPTRNPNGSVTYNTSPVDTGKPIQPANTNQLTAEEMAIFNARRVQGPKL